MLMSAAPTGDPNAPTARPWVRGEIDFREPHRDSCIFSGRCWLREQLGDPDRCTSERPPLRILEDGHGVACHFAEEVEARARQIETGTDKTKEVSLGARTTQDQADGTAG
jgi:hypothetical protein